MLTSMCNLDVLPTVIVTLFHRSLHAPLTLVMTFSNVRLKGYEIDCEGEDEMSDIVEKWTAQFESVTFVYQNRPPVGMPSSAFALASQGRIKTFDMQSREESSSPF